MNQAVMEEAMPLWGVSTPQWLFPHPNNCSVHFVQGENSHRVKSSSGGRETAAFLFTTRFAIVRPWVSTAIML